MGITVLLADSVPGIRKMEKAILEQEPDIEVVGEAEDESTAMKLSRRGQRYLMQSGLFMSAGR